MAGENETKEIYEGYEEAKNPAPPLRQLHFRRNDGRRELRLLPS